MTILRNFFFSLAIFLVSICPAASHQVDSVELEFLRPEGQWKLEGLLDISYMLPEIRGIEGAAPVLRDAVMNAPPAEQTRIRKEAERTLRKLLDLKYKGETVKWDIRFPDFEKEPLVLPPEAGDWALMKCEITMPSRPGPGKLEVFWNDDLESELIIVIEEGEDLGLLSVSSGMSDTLLKLDAPAANGTVAPAPATPDREAQAESWIVSGYKHVIPLGLDHLLFIFGLFLLAPRWKPLLTQSLLFTCAHSITLALAIYGLVNVPSRLVEILIAASIAWIGIENLISKNLKPQRLFIVFAFGLLHGLGFASVLGEKLGHLSGKQIALPLVSFNIGVELAQLTVLACAFLLLWPLKKWIRQFQTIGSVFVALAGLFWVVERILA